MNLKILKSKYKRKMGDRDLGSFFKSEGEYDEKVPLPIRGRNRDSSKQRKTLEKILCKSINI